jgi:hypothetical protein
MRSVPGDPTEIERLQDAVAKLLDQDWTGRDAEELAAQLRKLRVQITVATAAYQGRMRELQRDRARAS